MFFTATVHIQDVGFKTTLHNDIILYNYCSNVKCFFRIYLSVTFATSILAILAGGEISFDENEI